MCSMYSWRGLPLTPNVWWLQVSCSKNLSDFCKFCLNLIKFDFISNFIQSCPSVQNNMLNITYYEHLVLLLHRMYYQALVFSLSFELCSIIFDLGKFWYLFLIVHDCHNLQLIHYVSYMEIIEYDLYLF